jgi:hypothetical protein
MDSSPVWVKSLTMLILGGRRIFMPFGGKINATTGFVRKDFSGPIENKLNSQGTISGFQVHARPRPEIQAANTSYE